MTFLEKNALDITIDNAGARANDDGERLDELHRYLIMDSEQEKSFDEIASLASVICQTPVSMITFLDDNRQWFKSRIGFTDRQTPREVAFCSHTILQDEMLVINDATLDARFAANPLVTAGPKIRFYAGVPLISEDGHKLGTICVIDFKSRSLSQNQKFALNVLRDQVLNLLELRRKNMELAKLHLTNRKLLSIIGHDLKSPLDALSAMVELAEREALSMEEYRAHLPMLRKMLGSSQALLKNLLTWAKSEIVGLNHSLEKVDYSELLQAVIDANQHHLEKKGNTAVNELVPGQKGEVHKEMIAFVFRNLILNANKFSANRPIVISAVTSQREIVFGVKDDGVGIADSSADIFSFSSRKTGVGTHGETGSGLGLPMCKELVELHNGRIWFETTKGVGSVFYFSLPLGSKTA